MSLPVNLEFSEPRSQSPGLSPMRSPESIRRRAERLAGQRDEHQRRLCQTQQQIAEIDKYLELAVPVTDALRSLSDQLFHQVLGTMQSRLTIALQDVLEQPIEFQASASFRHKGAVVDFNIQREGFAEDVLLGQGGSVQNILSVGLRMFALATLDPAEHRPFLVLDEQDCWLRPELVPRLVHIISQAARELGFQVLMISHHDIRVFEKYADRILQLVPDNNRVSIREFNPQAETPDQM